MANQFEAALVSFAPHLLAFARAIAKNRAAGDDLAQTVIVRALEKQHLFEPGTNLKAWLFTIARNEHVNSIRRHYHRDVALTEDHAQFMSYRGDQELSAIFKSLNKAVNRLDNEHRQALILCVVNGVSYEEAAQICGVPPGTIKSRLSRVRDRLHHEMMGVAISDAEPPRRPSIYRRPAQEQGRRRSANASALD